MLVEEIQIKILKLIAIPSIIQIRLLVILCLIFLVELYAKYYTKNDQNSNFQIIYTNEKYYKNFNANNQLSKIKINSIQAKDASNSEILALMNYIIYKQK